MDTLANRNNNPGNLKDPETGTFRQFKTPQEGYAALMNDLEIKKTGRSKTGLKPENTLADFAKVYAPSSDNNNPAQYAANIANIMGSRPDAQLKDLDTAKWAEAVARSEGYKGNFSASQAHAATIPGAQPTPAPEQKMGLVQRLAQGIAKPFLKTAASAGALLEAGNEENYQKIQKEGLDFGYLGKATPIGAGFEVTKGLKENIQPLKEAIGTGAEIASYIAPVGALAKTAQAAKGGKALQVAAKGAFTGAEAGALQGAATGLQEEGSTLGSVAKSTGLGALTGTVTGGALGSAGGLVGKTIGQGKINSTINKRTEALTQIENANAKVRNFVEKQKQRGIDVKKGVADKDYLAGAVDEDGVIRTLGEGGPVAQYNRDIKETEGVISNLLRKEGSAVSLDQVKADLIEGVNRSGMKGASKVEALNKIEREIEGLRLDADPMGNIPVAAIHDAKVDKYANVNYMNEGGRLDKLIAKRYKQLVEKNTKSADVGKLNEELAQHFANIGYLEKLDGTRVSGGRLGKYFSSTLGAMVGGHFGPIGSMIGAEVGSRIKGRTLAGKLGGKTGKTAASSEAMKAAINAPTKLKVKSLPSEFSKELPIIEADDPGLVAKARAKKMPIIRY